MQDLFKNIKDKFSQVSEEKLMNLIAMGEVIVLQPSETFVKKGERTGKVALILTGIMRNYIINDQGQEITVFLASKMQIIAAYTSIFCDEAATETSEALEQSVLFVMDYRAFKSKALSDPELTAIFATMVEEALVGAIRRVEDFTQKSPEQRYKSILATQGDMIDRVPLKYLASYLGITAVSLSRIRKRLSKSRN